jgi:lysophospholipase L1-like esterase
VAHSSFGRFFVRHPTLKKFLFLLVTLLLFLAAFEAVCRLGLFAYVQARHFKLWGVTPQAQLQKHDRLGWVPVSRDRFRGAQKVSVEKPAGTFRIITMGDSCTHGAGVTNQQTYSKRLEQLLNEQKNAPRVQVLNAGVNGYQLEQMAIYLEEYLLVYQPDMVVVYANAFDSSDFSIEPGSRLAAATYPADRSPLESSLQAFQTVEELFFQAKSYYLLKRVVGFLKNRRPEDRPKGTELFDRKSGNLTRIRILCDMVGAELVIVEYVAQKDKDSKQNFYVPAWNATRQWEGHFVPIHKPMIFSGYSADQLFLDEVHPTVIGHALIAGQIAKQIWQKGLLPLE